MVRNSDVPQLTFIDPMMQCLMIPAHSQMIPPCNLDDTGTFSNDSTAMLMIPAHSHMTPQCNFDDHFS